MEQKRNLIQENSSFSFSADQEHHGQRIDKFISSHFSDYSRSFLQKLFTQKQVVINQSKTVKSGYSLKSGDQITISFPKPEEPVKKDIPHDLGVKIVAQEKDFFIVYKPAGLVSHPPHANSEDVALSDWLKQAYAEIAHVGAVDRPGIVHRLDKETSGLMIIPRTNYAHATMTDMFKTRKIKKTYLAIAQGHPDKEGTIDFFVGRHPTVRNKMCYFTNLTKQASSKDAVSHYKVIEYYDDCTLVEVKPLTGRTHQIRVHFAAIGHPLLADGTYGNKSKFLKRHALHAHKLEFEYKGKEYKFASELDDDLQRYLNTMQPIDCNLDRD